MRKIYFLIIATLFIFITSCAEDPQTKIPKYVEENGPLSFQEEKICDLIPRDVIQKYMDYTVEHYTSTPMNMQKYSMWGAGCDLNWNGPNDKVIDNTKVGYYLHAGNGGRITTQILSNFNKSTFENWSDSMLDEYKAKEIEGVEMTDEMRYVEIEGVGTRAIWVDAFSILKWHVSDEVLFSMQVNYPLDNEKRLAMAKEIAKHINHHLLEIAD